jgi:carbonic anhydrase
VTPDVLRSLVLAATCLGVTRVAVMHHTRCALADQDDADLRAGFGPAVAAATEGWELLAMPDPDAALAADVQAVRTCAALGPMVVEGWRYDVDTGLVDQIIPSDVAPL